MDENLNYETYLFISSKKLIISVNTNSNKRIYKDELILNDSSKYLDFEKLDFFLNKNIFKIEKELKNFIKETSLILDLDNFFSFEISIKKNNYEKFIDSTNINHVLYEAKDYCKKTLTKKKIIHMIINNYHVDGKNYSFLPKAIECDNFSLDIKFICIPDILINKLEDVLKKYQISINQVLCAGYIEKLISNGEKDIFLMAKKVIEGHNPNEVMLVKKVNENKGFFERFFNFFN